MFTKYVGVFCGNIDCRHFIVLSSHQADSPNKFGTDLDPTPQRRESCVQSVVSHATMRMATSLIRFHPTAVTQPFKSKRL